MSGMTSGTVMAARWRRCQRLRNWCKASAASVPKIIAAMDASAAIFREVKSASQMSSVSQSMAYHFVVKPSQVPPNRETLKEFTTSTAMGA